MISRAFSRKLLITLFIGLFCATISWAGQWAILGPDGGDVRSLSYDPRNPDHIFLGTSTGTIFSSADGGHNWSRFAHLGSGDDYVLDHIAIDPQNPKHMFVSAWSVENQQAGDLFRSHDGGKNWEALPGMHGKSVRDMAISASDSKVLVAGALDGIFRSSLELAFRVDKEVSRSDDGLMRLEPLGNDEVVAHARTDSDFLRLQTTVPVVEEYELPGPGLEDRRRRRELATHQQGHDRRLGRIFDHRRLH